MWLVIFPEGTRYNVNNKAVIEKSQAFATEQGKCHEILTIGNLWIYDGVHDTFPWIIFPGDVFYTLSVL